MSTSRASATTTSTLPNSTSTVLAVVAMESEANQLQVSSSEWLEACTKIISDALNDYNSDNAEDERPEEEIRSFTVLQKIVGELLKLKREKKEETCSRDYVKRLVTRIETAKPPISITPNSNFFTTLFGGAPKPTKSKLYPYFDSIITNLNALVTAKVEDKVSPLGRFAEDIRLLQTGMAEMQQKLAASEQKMKAEKEVAKKEGKQEGRSEILARLEEYLLAGKVITGPILKQLGGIPSAAEATTVVCDGVQSAQKAGEQRDIDITTLLRFIPEDKLSFIRELVSEYVNFSEVEKMVCRYIIFMILYHGENQISASLSCCNDVIVSAGIDTEKQCQQLMRKVKILSKETNDGLVLARVLSTQASIDKFEAFKKIVSNQKKDGLLPFVDGTASLVFSTREHEERDDLAKIPVAERKTEADYIKNLRVKLLTHAPRQGAKMRN